MEKKKTTMRANRRQGMSGQHDIVRDTVTFAPLVWTLYLKKWFVVAEKVVASLKSRLCRERRLESVRGGGDLIRGCSLRQCRGRFR
jgi:hypothetical protein